MAWLPSHLKRLAWHAEEESDDSEELDDYNEDALGEIGLKGNGAIYPGPFDPSDDDDAQDEPGIVGPEGLRWCNATDSKVECDQGSIV